jgi:hypothetical protein
MKSHPRCFSLLALVALAFALTTTASAQYTETVLFNFDMSHGAYPYAGLVFDSARNLYGAKRRN